MTERWTIALEGCDEFRAHREWRWAEAKFDGVRLAVYRDLSGEVYAFGRDARPHLEYFARYPDLWSLRPIEMFNREAGPMTCVDGELYVPGKPASEVSAVLAHPERFSELRWQPFAVAIEDGVELRTSGWNEQRQRLMRLTGVAPVVYKPLAHETVDLLYKRVHRDVPDAEGLVLKTGGYLNWMKWKKERDCDGVIVAVTEGNGKNVGLVGSVVVAAGGRVIARAAGFSDQERLEMTELDNAGELVGRVVQLKYQYVTSKGRLRHPRFVRFRDDKPAAECDGKELLS